MNWKKYDNLQNKINNDNHKSKGIKSDFKQGKCQPKTSTFCRYRQNALRLSRILRDQLHSPQDHALWLVEHVMNTKGADHLKTAARHLNFVQFFGIDILAFIILVHYVFWRYVKPLLKRVLCLFRKKVKSD